MFARLALFASPLTVTACATTPPAPDPSVNPLGHWTVVAVNGERTPADRPFWFEVGATRTRAQFGCNIGGGAARVDRGWLIPSSDWISTVAGCLPREFMRFERRGFAVTAKPMAIERQGTSGLRLRNEIGSVELSRVR